MDLMRREIRKPLRQVDGVVFLREPRHLADDRFGKLRGFLRTAWFHCPEIILCRLCNRISGSCWQPAGGNWRDHYGSVQPAVIFRRSQKPLHVLLRLRIRNAVDELVLRQARFSRIQRRTGVSPAL